MSIWNVSNPSDPITLKTEKFELAAAAAMLLGGGNYGAQEVGGQKREMPPMAFMSDQAIQDWFAAIFPELTGEGDGATPYDRFIDNLDRLELAEVLRTTQTCSVKEREAYEKALEAIDDGEKKQAYATWWKEQRTTSLCDITKRAWHLADKLEMLFRTEEQSAAPEELQ